MAFVSCYPAKGETDSGRGISPYTKRLARTLVRLGCSVSVVADRLGPVDERYQEAGVDVLRAWRPGFRAIADIERALRALRPDIVHFQHELFVFGRGRAALVPALLLKRLAPWLVITTIHGVIRSSDFGPGLLAYAGPIPATAVRGIYRRVVRAIVQSSSAVIVHNSAIAEALTEYCSPSHLEVIPLAIPDDLPSKWQRQDALREFGMDDRPRAVFLGYVLPYKGVETLVEAAPALAAHGVEVVVAGSGGGDDRPTHRMKMPSWTGVRRLGFVPERLIPALFSVTDVLVLPYSVGLSASGPLAMAIAYRTPPAVSNVATLRQEFGSPDATFTAGDPRSLADIVMRVINDESVRDAIIHRLDSLREERSSTAVGLKTLRCYQSLMTAPSRA